MGPGCDFCMCASLPLINIMMIYIIKYIKEEILCSSEKKAKNTLKNRFLIVILALAFTTPLFIIADRIYLLIANNKISVYNETNDGFADMLGYEGVWKPKGPISAEKDDNFYMNI